MADSDDSGESIPVDDGIDGECTTEEASVCTTSKQAGCCHEKPLSFQSLRSRCDDLVRSDHIDKNAGIEMLQIFHDMQHMFLNLKHAFQRHADRLRQELQGVKAENALLKKENERLLSELHTPRPSKHVSRFGIA